MCDCNHSIMYVPQGNDWGPKTWYILHTLSAKAGRQTDPIFQRDEMMAWQQVLLRTGNVLPCQECKTHYGNWLKARLTHVKLFLKLPYAEQATYVQRWFFDLHNDVNQRHSKPIMDFDIFQKMYQDASLGASIDELTAILKLYTQVSGYILSPVQYSEWKNYILTIKSFS